MSHITLIRHGQANSEAKDEAGYDKLSNLGWQQAKWLGAYQRDTGQYHARLYTGTLRRHIETAAAMDIGLDPIQDPRLNELEYFNLANALLVEQGIPIPQDQAGFTTHLPQVFAAWYAGELTTAPETFENFENRVMSAIQEIAAGDGPALVVTSGGLISCVIRQTMGLDIATMAQTALAIYNTSQHRLFPIGGRLSPVLFNAIPHLEPTDRHTAQTHV